MNMAKSRLIIVVNGGIVEDVYSTTEEEVEIEIIDCDTDDYDDLGIDSEEYDGEEELEGSDDKKFRADQLHRYHQKMGYRSILWDYSGDTNP